jgi:D-glycero-D-manno-heptose 1,7-bisphosphate phosphatase
MATPAVFLDRDGTINVEKNYLYRIEDWEWIPGAIDAIKLINQMGFLAVVVTNQSGVARGYYSEDDIKALHSRVDKLLATHGAKIDAYYYCPHHPDYGGRVNCICRKPSSGMLLQAQKDLDIDLQHAFLIGDRSSDIEAAIKVGVKPVIVKTGYGFIESKFSEASVEIKEDIFSAIKYIKSYLTRF